MGKLFGTDGVRGIPGRPPLTPELIRKLGYSAGYLLAEKYRAERRLNGTPPLVLMARDSRGSGAAIGRSLAQGFVKAGWRVVDLGVIPTPGLAYLVPRRGALCGAMISASHNPAEFNGIKFFTRDGFKMTPEIEDDLEKKIDEVVDPGPGAPRIGRDDGAAIEYVDYLKSTFPPDLDLAGMRIVVDCAHGAACRIGPRLFADLGATVFSIGCKPNGKNINLGCGALETGAMRREVVRRKAACGVSFDGDADRAIFADSRGRLCDGDMLISIAAAHLQDNRLLKKNKVVLTVMSNFGLIQYFKSRGIKVVSVPVGDKNVTDAIEQEGLSLGGENSGHIIFRRFSPSGDGLLTAVQILAVLAATKKDLASYRKRFKSYPQLLTNVKVARRVPLEELTTTMRLIEDCQKRLKGKGRVFVRYSGTEPLIRVLVEGPEKTRIKHMSREIITAFKKETMAREANGE